MTPYQLLRSSPVVAFSQPPATPLGSERPCERRRRAHLGRAGDSTGHFPADTGTALSSVCQLHVDRRPKATETIWAGVEPAALFRSTDGGGTFQLVEGLFEHPDRPTWEPGSCGLALHTLITHPERPEQVDRHCPLSAGVYRSDDGGDTWVARNQGIESGVLGESGQCVHKLAVDALDPDLLWAQGHGGIYKSVDAGDHWESVGHAGEPHGVVSDFGFPIVSHPEEPDTAYVLPLESDVYPCTPEGRCRVCTDDGRRAQLGCIVGRPSALQRSSNGPERRLLRRSQPTVPARVGTKSGHVFASVDSGESWPENSWRPTCRQSCACASLSEVSWLSLP